MAAVVRRLRPHLLLTYNWGAIETALAARLRRLPPLVHHEDGFQSDELGRRLRRRNLLRRCVLPKAEAVVVPSLTLRGIAVREWGLAEPRLQHLPNGVDCERFRPSDDGNGRPPCIGTVGGLRAEKDHATLLRAFAGLGSRACTLEIVGEGPMRGSLERLCAELGIAERVAFRGGLADPAAAYRGFDVFAVTSRTEQMPLAQLEAMATALPVAGTDVGDVRAMLPEECRGALVAPGDVRGLTAALDALLADVARRRREGAQNRARCLRDYELGACLDRYVAVYRRALGDP
jgi:glycosyltransferase involved in cell wall biosynthesis